MIPVTKPFITPLDEYIDLISGVWEREWFTNNGPLVNQLELELKNYLSLDHLIYVTNGTIALQLAIKALGLSKKIITTPFSYVATTSSLVWEGCTPVFADIDQKTLNIDPASIERLVDSETEAILATHCFGNPCDIDRIDKIASKYSLKVIYDASHCFGTKYKGKSVFEFGDISTTSFHATKLFHTIEGGCVFTSNPDILKVLAQMRNFGHNGPEKFDGLGINGKNSELHAAIGLVNLKYIEDVIAKRRLSTQIYNELLGDYKSDLSIIDKSEVNCSYYPVVFETSEIALKVKSLLESHDIFPRRYFYPSLSDLPYCSGNTPVANSISSRILCLPLYYDLERSEQLYVARIVLRALKN